MLSSNRFRSTASLHASPSLAGVAVVSDIVGSLTPKSAAERLQSLIGSFPQFSSTPGVADEPTLDRDGALESMRSFLDVLKRETPVVNVCARISRFITLMDNTPLTPLPLTATHERCRCQRYAGRTC
jgi:hypothetical protein